MLENRSSFVSELYSCYSAPCNRVKTAVSAQMCESFTFSSFSSRVIRAMNSKTDYFLNYLGKISDFPNEKEEQEPHFQQVSYIPIDNASNPGKSPENPTKNQINMNIYISIGEIQAKFFDCNEEKARFLAQNLEFSRLESYELAFNAATECISLKNLKERRVFLENILEIEKIHVFRDISLLSIHYLNENFTKSMAIVHAHLLICCKDAKMQSFVESFFENHLRKYHKNIIKPKEIARENAGKTQEGAVPSSPPQQFEEMLKKVNENPEKLKKDAISSFNDYFSEKPAKNPEKVEEKPRISQENQENDKKIHRKNRKIEEKARKLRELFRKSVKTLMKGFIFHKFGYHRLTFLQPQKRQLIFSSDLRRFVLVKPGKSIGKNTKFYSIDQILGIKEGRNTKNFARFKTKSSENLENSFSLELKTRSIDLQAGNPREKAEFCQALNVILQVHRSCPY